MFWRLCILIVLAHACWGARAPKEKTGKTKKSPKANVVFDRMVSFPEDGKTDVILLRNIGAKTVDLKGWWLADARKDKSNPEGTYFFGKTRGCAKYRKIPAGGVLELTPYLKSNKCGFPFGVSIEEELYLFDDEDELVSYVAWDWSLQGLVMRRLPDGTYKRFKENTKTMHILHEMKDFYLFIEGLKGAGLYEGLYAENEEDGDPLPDYAFKSPNDALPFQLAQEAGKKIKKSSKWPVKDQTAHFNGVPSDGPFTILAPTTKAMEKFMEEWEPAKGLSKEEVFELPEFKKVMEYHILPGNWMSGWIFNNLAISTSAGVDLVAFKGENSGGKLLLHESCKDTEPPGKYSCKEQRELGLCDRTFIKKNDYCHKTCGGCECTEGTCAEVVQADLYGRNGFAHVIDKVLIPGKPSKKETAKKKPRKSPAPDSQDDETESDNKEKEGKELNGEDEDEEQKDDDAEKEVEKEVIEDKDSEKTEEDDAEVDFDDEDEDQEDQEDSNREGEDDEKDSMDIKESSDEDKDEDGKDEDKDEDAKEVEESKLTDEDEDEGEFGEDQKDVEDSSAEDDEDKDKDGVKKEKTKPFSLLRKPGSDDEEEEESESSTEVEEKDSFSENGEDTDPEDPVVEKSTPARADSTGLKTKRRKRSTSGIQKDDEKEDDDKSKQPISKRRGTGALKEEREVPTGL